MRVFAIRSVCRGNVRERVDTDIMPAPMLSLRYGGVRIDRERSLGEQTDSLGNCRLRNAAKGRMSTSMCG